MLAAARTGAAQTQWSVDAAFSRLKPVAGARTNAGALSALAQQQYGSITPMLAAAATIAGDSVAAAQLLFGASALPPWSNRMPFDAGVVTALYGIAAGDRGQSLTVFARQHMLTSIGGYWIGGAYGSIDRTSNFRSNEVNAAAWMRFGKNRVTAEVSTTRTDDREVFNGTSIPAKPFATSVRVGDATLKLERTSSRLEVEALAGVRVGLEGSSGTAGFGNATLAWRFSGRTSVVVGGGSRFSDPLRGTPEWKYVSIGLRIRNSATRVIVPPNLVGPPLTIERAFDGNVVISVDALPGVRTIEVMGTMTRWHPVSMVRGANSWTVTIPAASGPHQVMVRIDGIAWRPPSNLPTVADEFGQRSGLIVIP